MSIKYYTGVPRSGKTYKAMHLLYYTFVNEELSKFDKFLVKYKLKNEDKNIHFDNAYTNINQFNFDISDKIFQLDFEKLYSQLQFLHIMYKAKKTDSELIEKAKEFKIYNSLFVLDECHNFLKTKDDDVLVWWFTYHAHLHHELILITQDLSLVNTEYKRVAEYFYKAIPSRFRMSKNIFKYIQYSTYGMYEKDKIGVETARAEKKIFSLYVSGSDSNGKSILHKYIFFAVLSLLICFVSAFFMFDSIVPENEKSPILSNNSSNLAAQKQQIIPGNTTSNLAAQNDLNNIVLNTNLTLFKFVCYSKFCYFNQDNLSVEIPINILKSFLLNIDDNKKFTDLSNNRLLIYILDDENKFKFLYKGVKDEKSENDSSLFGSTK